jgi:hypothetical protein
MVKNLKKIYNDFIRFYYYFICVFIYVCDGIHLRFSSQPIVEKKVVFRICEF